MQATSLGIGFDDSMQDKPGTAPSGGRRNLPADDWLGDTNVNSQDIPDYDASADPHCTYSRSKGFKSSPFSTVLMQSSQSDTVLAGQKSRFETLPLPPPPLQRNFQATDADGAPAWRTAAPPEIPTSFNSEKAAAQATQVGKAVLQLEDAATNIIEKRERLIERIRSSQNDNSASLMQRVYKLRTVTVKVVEAIEAWRGALSKADQAVGKKVKRNRTPFIWNGHIYMLKLITDLNFFAEIPAVVNSLSPGCLLRRNPFTMPSNLDQALDPVGQAEATHDTVLECGLQSELVRKAEIIISRDEILQRRGLLSESPQLTEHERQAALSPALVQVPSDDRGVLPPQELTSTPSQRFGLPVPAPLKANGSSSTPEWTVDGGIPTADANALAPMVSVQELKRIWTLDSVPTPVGIVFACIRIILATQGELIDPTVDVDLYSWKAIKAQLRSPKQFITQLHRFTSLEMLPRKKLQALRPFLLHPGFHHDYSDQFNAVSELRAWVVTVVQSQPVDGSGESEYEMMADAAEPPDAPTGADVLFDTATTATDAPANAVDYDADEDGDQLDVTESSALRAELASIRMIMKKSGLLGQDATNWQATQQSTGSEQPQTESGLLHKQVARIGGRSALLTLSKFAKADGLNIRVVDVATSIGTQANMNDIFVKRFMGASSVRMHEVRPADIRTRLKPIIAALSLSSGGTQLQLDLDRTLFTAAMILPGAEETFRITINQQINGDGVEITASLDSEDEIDENAVVLSMTLLGHELDLLLIQKPGAIFREWNSRCQAAAWLSSRLSVKENSGGHRSLLLDRAISITVPVLPSTWVEWDGPPLRLHMEQRGSQLLVEAHHQDDQVDQSIVLPARVGVSLEELKVFLDWPEEDVEQCGTDQLLVDLIARIRVVVAADRSFLDFDRKLLEGDFGVTSSMLSMVVSMKGNGVQFTGHPANEPDGIEVSKIIQPEETQQLVQIAIAKQTSAYTINDVDYLLRPKQKAKLALFLLESECLKLVPPRDDIGNHRLETVLFCQEYLLTIASGGTSRKCCIGAVEITDFTTLEQLRALINEELELADVPKGFRFRFRGVPCGRRQERRRLAVKCLPTCVILSPEHMQRARSGVVDVDAMDDHATNQGHVSFASHENARGRDSQLVVRQADKTSPKKKNAPSPTPQTRSSEVNNNAVGSGGEESTEWETDGDGASQAAEKKKKKKKKKKDVPSYMKGTAATAAPKFDAAPGDGGDSQEATKNTVLAPHEINLPLPGSARVTRGMMIVETSQDMSLLAAPAKVTSGSKLRVANFEEETYVVDLIDGCMITLEQAYQGPDGDKELLSKVILDSDDTRPAWLRQYAADRVEWTIDHENSDQTIRKFGISVKHSWLEGLIKLGEDEEKADKPMLHFRRVNYFDKLKREHIVLVTFQLLCTWYPSADSLEGSKFAKFAREFGLIAGRVKANDVDLAFTKSKKSGERRINVEEFNNALHIVTYLKYGPRMDLESSHAMHLPEEEAMRLLLWEFLAMYPAVNLALWQESKLMAMSDEAVQQCGAINIQCLIRRFLKRLWYLKHIEAVTRIQARYRTYIARCRYLKILTHLAKEAYFRYINVQATVIQNVFRRYFHQARFQEHQKLLAKERAEKEFKRWDMLHKKRLTRETLKAFKEGRRVNGVLVVVSMYKKAGQGDNGVVVRAYIPTSCETFIFNVTELELRHMLHQALNVTDLALGELYVRAHLSLIADRLMYRWCRGRQIIKLSKRGNGERGTLVSRQGMKVSGVKYVVDIYEYNKDLVVKTYDGRNSEILRTEVTSKKLRAWVLAEDGKDRNVRRRLRNNQRGLAASRGDWASCAEIQTEQAKDDEDENDEPYLLQRRGFDKLLIWVTGRLYVNERVDRHTGQPKNVLMLQFEVEEEFMNRMVRKIQGMWRCRKARQKIRLLIKAIYQKRFDPAVGAYYYINTRSGECSWTKPINLGTDDINDPSDDWQKMTDEYGNTFYLHPLTGRTSWLSEQQSAVKMQRLWRKRCAADFRVDDLQVIIRALRFQRETETKFLEHPDRLPSIVNYALLMHTVEHDYLRARQYYKQAMNMAPHNPMVMVAYALFLICVCEPPQKTTWMQANKMLRTAQSRDADFDKFKVAQDSFFHWAMISQPASAQALLNWAIVKQCIHKEYDEAEKLYRRAVELDHTDMLVMQVSTFPCRS
jgi:hypothetical protein